MNATIPLPITWDQLTPKTRDWLLAKSAKKGVAPQHVLAESLDQIARREIRTMPPRTTEPQHRAI